MQGNKFLDKQNKANNFVGGKQNNPSKSRMKRGGSAPLKSGALGQPGAPVRLLAGLCQLHAARRFDLEADRARSSDRRCELPKQVNRILRAVALCQVFSLNGCTNLGGCVSRGFLWRPELDIVLQIPIRNLTIG